VKPFVTHRRGTMRGTMRIIRGTYAEYEQHKNGNTDDVSMTEPSLGVYDNAIIDRSILRQNSSDLHRVRKRIIRNKNKVMACIIALYAIDERPARRGRYRAKGSLASFRPSWTGLSETLHVDSLSLPSRRPQCERF